MLRSIYIAALIAGGAATLSLAQPLTPTTLPAVGAVVKDKSGGVVGTIASVHGENLVIKTDRNEALFPMGSFTRFKGELIFGLTREELNAQVDQMKANANSTLIPGAIVRGNGGVVVGTIDAIDEEYVTLMLSSGSKIRLPRQGIAAGPGGGVVGLSAAELGAAAQQALKEAESP